MTNLPAAEPMPGVGHTPPDFWSFELGLSPHHDEPTVMAYLCYVHPHPNEDKSTMICAFSSEGEDCDQFCKIAPLILEEEWMRVFAFGGCKQ